MKIKYQPLCQGATAIPAEAVLKDYGDVNEVCSECGVPVGETKCGVCGDPHEVATIKCTVQQMLLDYTAWVNGEPMPWNVKKAEGVAQLESIMQDYAIEARLSENRRSAAGEYSIQTLRKLKARERELQQLRTANRTLKGEE